MASQDDNGNMGVRDRQMPEEVEAAHSGQAQIEHQATGVPSLSGSQELFRRGERLDSEAHGPQEIPEGPAQRFVIVYDGDRRPVALVHTSSLSLSERLIRIHLLPCQMFERDASTRPWRR